MQESWLLIENGVSAVILIKKEIEAGTRTINGAAQKWNIRRGNKLAIFTYLTDS